MKKNIIFAFILFSTVCCTSIDTKNPEEAYVYWSGSKPPDDMILYKGQYYQSPHFSLEYEFFLKFKPTKKWLIDFISYNKLEIDTIGNDWRGLTKVPSWFKPNSDFIIYSKNQSDEFERSRYFRNRKTGVCYIYETIGM